MGGYLSTRRSDASEAEAAARDALPARPLVSQIAGGNQHTYQLHPELLGEGAFAYVVKATVKETGLDCVVKVSSKEAVDETPSFHQEIRVMNGLRHPNIVNLHEGFEDESNIYLVMDFCRGGELFTKICEMRKFSEFQAAITMQQVLQALSYLHHSQHIVHRDVKPENLVYDDDQGSIETSTLKLVDFGLARKFVPGGGNKMHTQAGTTYYVAPEVLKGSYTEVCDVWSAGVLLYLLLSGRFPFSGESPQEITSSVRQGTVYFPQQDWGLISEHAKTLVMNMLFYRSKDRITAQRALLDKWIERKGQVGRCCACTMFEGWWRSRSSSSKV
mmetsp:Transcript_60122/g.143279  ORF Transcript_60122/g.143279 Transcript_60122/m.143279 type:complete len:330 (-) Transcript_60122:54-1043(-)